MPSFGTLVRQPSRLPIALDLAAELFYCTRLHCRLTKTACGHAHAREKRAAVHVRGVNRLRLTGQADKRGYRKPEHAIAYSPCASCEIGAANAARVPTQPQHTEIIVMTEEQQPQPLKAAAAERKARRRRKRKGAGKVALAPKAALAKPRAVPTLPRIGGKTASEWLALVGFKVRAIETPGGVFLELN